MAQENLKKYFEHRNIKPEFYDKYIMPLYLEKSLPGQNAEILDIGCGLGQVLIALSTHGYKNIEGIDVSQDAIDNCLQKNLRVTRVDGIIEFCAISKKKYDFIIMSHVLEHLNKADIIDTLGSIRRNLLKPEGQLLIVVPNAQSNTGCYWAYEDFTHQTLFTAGSLYYVLKAAGYADVLFLDQDGLEGSMSLLRWIKKALLFTYKANLRFWNLVTGSSFHCPSPQIFTYELKALAN